MPWQFTDPSMPAEPATMIRRAYRPLVAHRHVAALSQYHRIQASPGYRAAARYVVAQLAAAGVQASILPYPAAREARYWSTPGFQEWEVTGATLDLLDETGRPVESLCDFAAIPTSLIQRSIPVEGDFEVVLLPGKGSDASSYGQVDVAGKLILTDESPGPLLGLAVRQAGAAGFLFDGMAAGGRSDLDLPDARQYTSFWWTGPAGPDAFGFVLSPRQGRRLRAKVEEWSSAKLSTSEGPSSGSGTAGEGFARGKGGGVWVRARIDSRFYDGSLDVVEAVIPGSAPAEDAGEILLVAHLCHPQPGAHDNASGAAALLEAAATLARLIQTGELPRPRRGIRCLWVPEMTGTYAWLSAHEEEVRAGRWLAGLNLDMVGADQNASGSAWDLVGLPQAAAAFPDHLLAWLREPFLEGQRYRETPFSGGSDHYILSDPTVGIPSPMLIQWPDKFYHTSADTVDKVSPDSLGRSGALAALYAAWLSQAGPTEARWLGHWMLGRFTARASRLASEAAEAIRAAVDPAGRSAALARYRKQNAFRTERAAAAFESLRRLAPDLDSEIERWRGQIGEAAAREEQWVLTLAGEDAEAGAPDLDPGAGPGARLAGAEPGRAEAAGLVAVRRLPGPIDVDMAIRLCDPGIQAAWAELAGAGHGMHELGALLQYWADGRRTVAQVAEAVALERDEAYADDDMALRYFKLLAQAGLLELTPVEQR